MRKVTVAATLFCCLLFVRPAAAQIAPEPVDQKKIEEVSKWAKDAAKWLKWARKKFNRTMKTTMMGRPAKRPRRPLPPEWLQSYCLGTPKGSEQPVMLKIACDLDAEINHLLNGSPVLAQTMADQAFAEEDDRRTTFLERIHLDGMYTVTQVASGRGTTYAVIGMHMTIVDVGRVQFYLPPGFLLLSEPTANGGRRWRPAYTWGISVELMDFELPGSKQLAVMHLNVTKVWAHGSVDPTIGLRSGRDMVGLSFTWKRPPGKPPSKQ
ncbi:MAG TPA: hypothetical protein VD998_03770 [Verrucomicrobiae bacterium]|nr:hypothetical protein [Verrucomicrobiae bacterium]